MARPVRLSCWYTKARKANGQTMNIVSIFTNSFRLRQLLLDHHLTIVKLLANIMKMNQPISPLVNRKLRCCHRHTTTCDCCLQLQTKLLKCTMSLPIIIQLSLPAIKAGVSDPWQKGQNICWPSRVQLVSVCLHYFLVSPNIIWLPWQCPLTNRKNGIDPSSASKALSYGVKFVKISPVEPEIFD